MYVCCMAQNACTSQEFAVISGTRSTRARGASATNKMLTFNTYKMAQYLSTQLLVQSDSLLYSGILSPLIYHKRGVVPK